MSVDLLGQEKNPKLACKSEHLERSKEFLHTIRLPITEFRYSKSVCRMITKNPFITIALFMGMGLLILFSFSYVWLPLIQSSQVLVAIAEVLAFILGLITLCFGIMYYSIKKRSGPDNKQTGIVSKMPEHVSKKPVKENNPTVITMPMTG